MALKCFFILIFLARGYALIPFLAPIEFELYKRDSVEERTEQTLSATSFPTSTGFIWTTQESTKTASSIEQTATNQVTWLAQTPTQTSYSMEQSAQGSVPTDVPSVTADAPLMISAEFTTDGYSIVVTFNQSLMVVDPVKFVYGELDPVPMENAIPCSDVFVPGQFQENNNDCTLRQTSGTTLMLTMTGTFTASFEAAIIIGGVLEIKPSVVVAVQAESSRDSSGSIVVSAPASITDPVVSVVAPQVISACADLTFDFSSVSGKLGRKWQAISFTFSSAETGPADPQLYNLLEGFSKSLTAETISTATIPKDMLAFGTYTFVIQYTNWMYGVGEATLLVERSSSSSVPELSIYSKLGTANVPVGVNNFVKAKISGSSCTAMEKLMLTWSSAQVAIQYPSSSTVSIPKFTLSPLKTYKINLQARYESSNETFDFSYSFSTAIDKIEAAAGSSYTSGEDNAMSLTPIINDDSYSAPLDLSMFICSWTCQTTEGNTCISKNTSSVLQLPDTCSEQTLTGRLSRDITYNFAVLVTNRLTNAATVSSAAQITVTSGSIPLIEFEVEDLNPSIHSTDFDVKSVVDTRTISSLESISYAWTSESSCNSKTFSQVDLSTSLLTSLSGQNLKFRPGQLSPSTSYCFALTVTDLVSGKIGKSSVEITTRAVPSGGTCSISATTGVAFTDRIVYSCQDWSTDARSMPLIYKLLWRKSANSPWRVLRSGTEEIMSTFLGRGVFFLKVEIGDSAGSINSGEITSTISMSGKFPVP